MRKTSVYLTEEEAEGLRRLAQATGKSQSQLIREGIGKLLARRPKRVFHSMGKGAGGDPDPPRRWDADELHDHLTGARRFGR